VKQQQQLDNNKSRKSGKKSKNKEKENVASSPSSNLTSIMSKAGPGTQVSLLQLY
jgi:hypothetical protein